MRGLAGRNTHMLGMYTLAVLWFSCWFIQPFTSRSPFYNTVYIHMLDVWFDMYNVFTPIWLKDIQTIVSTLKGKVILHSDYNNHLIFILISIKDFNWNLLWGFEVEWFREWPEFLRVRGWSDENSLQFKGSFNIRRENSQSNAFEVFVCLQGYTSRRIFQ